MHSTIAERLEVTRGSIVTFAIDAIVNAANTSHPVGTGRCGGRGEAEVLASCFAIACFDEAGPSS